MSLADFTRVVCVAAVMILLPLRISDSAAAQTKPAVTVLTIHWGAEDFPGTATIDAAIHDALRSRLDAPVNYYAEYLESETFAPRIAEPALRDYIRTKYRDRHIDLVIASTTPAFDFALQNRDQLFPGVPIVFLAGRIPDNVNTARVTGIVSDNAFAETLELALRLHPTVSRVFVVAQAPTVADYDRRVQAALSRFTSRVAITYIKAKSVPELLAAVKAVPTPSLILFNRYTPAPPDRVVYSDEIARLMAQVSPVPIYASTDLFTGSGIVGGMMRESHVTGTRVGQMARQILDGVRPEDIPVVKVPLVPVFDWRQLKRWRIDPAALPPGSEIRFRVPTLWEAYRSYIIATLLVVTAQLTLILALLAQRARRQRAEEGVRASEAELRRSFERIRRMAGRLIDAQETARAGVAQDLHDDVCQRLVHVNLAVSDLKNSSGEIRGPGAQRALTDLETDISALFDELRRLSHDLHPFMLRILGLAPALRAHCQEIERRHGVVIEFLVDGNVADLDSDVALCVFRVAQEALRNAVGHGQAQLLQVTIARSDSGVTMTITDDGKGFDPETVASNGGGLGLVSMEERAHLVGGSLEIVSATGRGTVVRMDAPVEAHSVADVAVVQSSH